MAAHGPSLQAKALKILKITLTERLDLYFGQHMANMLACIIYGVCKAHQVQIPLFQHIWQAVSQSFRLAENTLFQKASLITYSSQSASPGSTEIGQTVPGPKFEQPSVKIALGDTRKLYNQSFLPSMEQHLQQVCIENSGAKSNKPIACAATAQRRPPLGTLTVHDLNSRQSGLKRLPPADRSG